MVQQVKEFESLSELLNYLDDEGYIGSERQKAVNSYLSAAARMKKKPIIASFELTPLCNFDCKMCYVHLTSSQMKEHRLLTTDEWKRIIDMSVAAGVMFADITGGECLTYPGFKEVYLHLMKAGIQPSVLTNGSLLTEEMIQFLSQHPPKTLQITIYGSNEAAYRRVTGCDAFERVMTNVKRAREAKLPVKLIMTPSRYMQDDAKEILALLRSLGVDYGIGGITLPARPETERAMADYQIDMDFYIQLQKDDIAYRTSLRSPGVMMPPRLVPKGRQYEEGVSCSAGKCAFHVNWKGEMTPCISYHSVTSSMLEHGFDAAWKEIQTQMATYREPEECDGCELRRYCSSCPAEKSGCVLGGPLNHYVCERLRAYMDAGLVGPTSEGKICKGVDVVEEELC